MSSKLSLYWQPYHINGDPYTPSGDWAILARWQPPSVRLFQYWWPDPLFMEQLFRLLPNSVINLRDHPLSEEKNEMLGDPVATGRRHAQSFIDRIAPLRGVKGFSALRLLCAGVNEPPIGNNAGFNDPEKVRAVVAYEVARLDALRAAGLRGLALSLSVGWPSNTGKDTPSDWAPFEPVRDAILRGQHMLGLHEYWGPQGPAAWRGWWVDRLGMCPWDVPILVGECGEDHGVVDGRNDGWLHVGLTVDAYLAQLIWYDREVLQRDPRVYAGEIFSYDAVDPFKSFDIRGDLAERVAAYVVDERNTPPPAPLPFPRYPDGVRPPAPPIPPEVPMATVLITTPAGDALAARLRAVLGDKFRDKRTTIRRSATWKTNPFYNTDAHVMPWIVCHYSTGLPGPVSSESMADYHIDTNRWPGLGYHFVIDEGHLDYVGDINTRRAHIAGLNDKGIGVCFTGLYTTTLPSEADQRVARALVAALDDHFGHKKELKGHWHVNGASHTPCPGRIVEILPTLREDASSPWSISDAQTTAWRLERLAAARRGDVVSRDQLIASLFEAPSAGEHALITMRALPPIYEERDV